jgi:acetyl esterase/lipase
MIQCSFSIVVGLLLCSFCSIASAQQTSEQFKRWDVDRDGKVSSAEFPEGRRPLFDRIDANQDGFITPQEERQFLAGNAQRQGQPGQMPPPRVPETVRAEFDLSYAQTDNPRQRLDLFLPKKPNSEGPLPVVAFVHGGGWQNGDKRGGAGFVVPLVASGDYAGVSIGYRLTDETIWPAQIHDCKAAIRWIRANAKKYNLDPDRIGVTGGSAGGHLVAVLGTSGDVAELEGSLGETTTVSSRVACVVDQFGPADLLTMGGWHNGPGSPEAKLIGGPVQDNKDKARAASPITYVTKDDPPCMMIHGTKDSVVPFSQSEELLAALQKAGVEAVLVPVEGGEHGNFATPEVPRRAQLFFDKHLRGQDVSTSSDPIKAGKLGPVRQPMK